MSKNSDTKMMLGSAVMEPTLNDFVEDDDYVEEIDAINDETFGGGEEEWDPDEMYDLDNQTSSNKNGTEPDLMKHHDLVAKDDRRKLDELFAATTLSDAPFDDPAIVTCQRAPAPPAPPSPIAPPPPPPPPVRRPPTPPAPPTSATTLEELESTFTTLNSSTSLASGLLGNSVWALTKDEQEKLISWPEPKKPEPPRPPPPMAALPKATNQPLLTCESLEQELISFSDPAPQPPPAPSQPPGLPPLPISAIPIRLEDLEKEIMQPDKPAPAQATTTTVAAAAAAEPRLVSPIKPTPISESQPVNPWVKRAAEIEQKQQQKLTAELQQQQKLADQRQAFQNMVPPLIRPIPVPLPRGLSGMGPPIHPAAMLHRPAFPLMYVRPGLGPIHPMLHPMSMLQRFGPPPMHLHQLQQQNRPQQQQPLFAGMMDEYAGLMTQREKDWLHKIQFMQLEGSFTDPYKEDYYYVAFNAQKIASSKQQSAVGGGINNTPPQLIVPERGNRQRTGSTEERDNDSARPRLKYEPLQFAGSLGKIQVSNLNRPRKLLELNALNASAEPGNAAVAPLPSRTELAKLRKLLLDIERLYLIVLDIDYEDKRMAALPEAARSEHQETRRQLCQRLFEGLLTETGQLNDLIASIRKGRTLIFRAIGLLGDIRHKAFLITQVIDRKLHALQKPDEISLYGIDYVKLLRASIEEVNKVLPVTQKVVAELLS